MFVAVGRRLVMPLAQANGFQLGPKSQGSFEGSGGMDRGCFVDCEGVVNCLFSKATFCMRSTG